MCGFAGLFPWKGRARAALPLLERSAAALAARGPDARFVGYLGTCAAAATRLAVVDRTKASDPPIVNSEGTVALLYNGELYEADALRKELAARGHRFRSQGDGEVVLAAYLEFGTAFLREVDGMFALALVDQRDSGGSEGPAGTLVLARDRFGEKPLVFARVRAGLAFASTVAAIRPLLDDVAPDLDALASVVRHGFAPGGTTPLAGVRRIRPGTALICQPHGTSIYPFAERRVPEEPLSGDARTFAPELWERIRAAVRRRARSEAGLGLFLSGGLDSAALARALTEEGIPFRAYTAGFRGGPSEIKLAGLTAESLRIPWTSVELGPEVLERWEGLTREYGEPLADASVLNVAALAARARSDAPVVLTGEGGDELLGGYRRERAYARIRDVSLPRFLARGLRSLGGEWERVGRALARPPGLGRYQELRDRVSEGEELLLPAYHRGDALTDENLPGEATSLASDLYSYLPDDLLLRLDAGTMAESVEGRAVFLDSELADFALALPPATRQGIASGKRVLRAALEGKLPRAVLAGRKVGFGPPIARWFRETGFAEKILTDPRSCAPPLDRTRVLAALEEHRRGARDRSIVLARAIAVELHRAAMGAAVAGRLD